MSTALEQLLRPRLVLAVIVVIAATAGLLMDQLAGWAAGPEQAREREVICVHWQALALGLGLAVIVWQVVGGGCPVMIDPIVWLDWCISTWLRWMMDLRERWA